MNIDKQDCAVVVNADTAALAASSATAQREGAAAEPRIDSQANDIRLSDVGVSRANPRHLQSGDESPLGESIATNSLLQPIVLRRCDEGSGPNKFEVIAGWRRLRAIRASRGVDGVLHRGEYRIIDCTEAEAAIKGWIENHDRLAPSVIEEARQIELIAELNQIQTDEALSKLTGLGRQRVNSLRALVSAFNKLPASWQSAYATSSCRTLDSEEPFRLSEAHFDVIRRYVSGESIPPNVAMTMEDCVALRWSSRKLRHEIVKSRKDSSGSQVGLPAVRRFVLKAMKACSPGDDLVAKLRAVLCDIKQRLANGEKPAGAAESGNGKARRAQKSAEEGAA